MQDNVNVSLASFSYMGQNEWHTVSTEADIQFYGSFTYQLIEEVWQNQLVYIS